MLDKDGRRSIPADAVLLLSSMPQRFSVSYIASRIGAKRSSSILK
jgi:hypothetical protein